MGSPWLKTPERVARVERMASAGLTAEEIGQRLGKSKAAVLSFMQRHGIRSAVDNRSHPAVIASRDKGRAIYVENCRRRATNLAGRVEDAVRAGMRPSQVAARLGVHPALVASIRERFGIDPPPGAIRRKFGLPKWMTRTEFLVLVTLMDGPLGRRPLAVRLGKGDRGVRVQRLIGQGYVAVDAVGGPRRGRRGPPSRLYWLTDAGAKLFIRNPNQDGGE